jgi:hypothetical protein
MYNTHFIFDSNTTNMAQERGLEMVAHSAIIGVILYFIMTMLLKQPQRVAEDRSVAIAGVVLVYMVVFGHGLPGAVSPSFK